MRKAPAARGARGYTGRMNSTATAAPMDTEIRKFDALAHEFWDPRGAFKPLHALNAPRVDYVAQRSALSQRRVLDIGCGGGLLAEALTRHGAHVSALDMAPAMIEVARLHAHESQLQIDYHLCSAEQFAAQTTVAFDVITCMELVEHVPSPAGLLAAIATLLRPGGDLFISTINRNLRSFLLAIVSAEYLLRLIPRGTHEYARLLRPAELARLARAEHLALCDIGGLDYNPFSNTARLTADASVNYLAHFRREVEPA
jgi:2-polyprenyl-6-hydroxyphenyl methylase / 3-demethylubiquinone-9 3-methyltransferase